MKDKDIDKAAREYAEELSKLDDKRMYDRIDASAMREVAFRAGAQSCQSEIDELIEALEEMRWIPVSERLPNTNNKSGISKDVLIDTGIYKTAQYCKNKYYSNGAWFCLSEELQSYPTHWRPIDTPKATQLLKRYENEKDNKG